MENEVPPEASPLNGNGPTSPQASHLQVGLLPPSTSMRRCSSRSRQTSGGKSACRKRSRSMGFVLRIRQSTVVPEGKSFFVFGPSNPLRKGCVKVVNSMVFHQVVLLIVILNAMAMAGMDPTMTEDEKEEDDFQRVLKYFDLACLCIYVLEMLIKMIAMGAFRGTGCYWKDPWNRLDFIVVTLSWIGLMGSEVGFNSPMKGVNALRVLRAIKPLRMVKSLPGIRAILDSLSRSIPLLASTTWLFIFFFFTFAVITVEFYMESMDRRCAVDVPVPHNGTVTLTLPNTITHEIAPNRWCNDDKSFGNKCSNPSTCRVLESPFGGMVNFDNLLISMLVLFQVVTLDSWSFYLYSLGNSEHWMWTLALFTMVIVLLSFVVVNLFLAVIHTTFSKVRKEQQHSGFCDEMTAPRASEDKALEIIRIREEEGECFAPLLPIQRPIKRVVQSNAFMIGINVCIVFNVLVQSYEASGLDSVESNRSLIDISELIFLSIFTVEIILRAISFGTVRSFFRKDPWNTFDLLLVVASLVGLLAGNTSLSFFRAVRLLRVLRLLKRFDGLQRLLLAAVAGLLPTANVLLFTFFVLFVFVCMGMQMFGGKFNVHKGDNPTIPNNYLNKPWLSYIDRLNFDQFDSALILLFQVMTGDTWSAYMWYAMNTDITLPWFQGALYFVAYYFVAGLIILSLFTVVILENFELSEEEKQNAARRLRRNIERLVLSCAVEQRRDLRLLVEATQSKKSLTPRDQELEWRRKLEAFLNLEERDDDDVAGDALATFAEFLSPAFSRVIPDLPNQVNCDHRLATAWMFVGPYVLELHLRQGLSYLFEHHLITSALRNELIANLQYDFEVDMARKLQMPIKKVAGIIEAELRLGGCGVVAGLHMSGHSLPLQLYQVLEVMTAERKRRERIVRMDKGRRSVFAYAMTHVGWGIEDIEVQILQAMVHGCITRSRLRLTADLQRVEWATRELLMDQQHSEWHTLIAPTFNLPALQEAPREAVIMSPLVPGNTRSTASLTLPRVPKVNPQTFYRGLVEYTNWNVTGGVLDPVRLSQTYEVELPKTVSYNDAVKELVVGRFVMACHIFSRLGKDGSLQKAFEKTRHYALEALGITDATFCDLYLREAYIMSRPKTDLLDSDDFPRLGSSTREQPPPPPTGDYFPPPHLILPPERTARRPSLPGYGLDILYPVNQQMLVSGHCSFCTLGASTKRPDLLPRNITACRIFSLETRRLPPIPRQLDEESIRSPRKRITPLSMSLRVSEDMTPQSIALRNGMDDVCVSPVHSRHPNYVSSPLRPRLHESCAGSSCRRGFLREPTDELSINTPVDFTHQPSFLSGTSSSTRKPISSSLAQRRQQAIQEELDRRMKEKGEEGSDGPMSPEKGAPRFNIAATDSAGSPLHDSHSLGRVRSFASTASTGRKTLLRFKLPETTIDAKSWGIFGLDNPVRIACMRIDRSLFFQIFILLVVIASSVLVVFLPRREAWQPGGAEQQQWMFIAEVVFIIIFSVEVIIKVTARTFYSAGEVSYIAGHWNKIDLVVLLCQVLALTLPDIKALRLTRAIRSLRLINRIEGLQVVLNALLASLSIFVNVFVAGSFFVFLFGLMGYHLFHDRFGHCTNPMWTGFEHKDNCTGVVERTLDGEVYLVPMAWIKPQATFDTIQAAMATCLEVASLSSWSMHAYNAMDITEINRQPQLNHSKWTIIYFVVVIAMCTFFLVNLFIGVIITNINSHRGVEIMDERQQSWALLSRTLTLVRLPAVTKRPDHSVFRAKCFDVAENKRFMQFVLAVIVINVVLMGTKHRTEPQWWTETTNVLNNIFVGIFTIEMVIKLAAYGMVYFQDPWNRFDFLIVWGSLFALLATVTFGSGVNLTVISVARIFRIGRIFRLVRGFKGISTMFHTLLVSLPQILNISLMLLILVFIYAVIGMNYFSHVRFQLNLNANANFRSFSGALSIVFRMVTLDDWNKVMRDCTIRPPRCVESSEWDDCGSRWGFAYFFSFFVIGSYIFLNLVIAVILDNFSHTFDQSNQVLSQTEEMKFVATWLEFDPEATGVIPRYRLYSFIMALHRSDCALAVQGCIHPHVFSMRFKAMVYELDLMVADRVKPKRSGLRFLKKRVDKEADYSYRFKEVLHAICWSFHGFPGLGFEELNVRATREAYWEILISVSVLVRAFDRSLAINRAEKEVNNGHTWDRLREVRQRLQFYLDDAMAQQQQKMQLIYWKYANERYRDNDIGKNAAAWDTELNRVPSDGSWTAMVLAISYSPPCRLADYEEAVVQYEAEEMGSYEQNKEWRLDDHLADYATEIPSRTVTPASPGCESVCRTLRPSVSLGHSSSASPNLGNDSPDLPPLTIVPSLPSLLPLPPPLPACSSPPPL